MQRRLDAKLSVPKQKNPVVYKPMEQDHKAVQFKLQDNYKQKLQLKREQQTSKERAVCTFKPDLKLTKKGRNQFSTQSQIVNRHGKPSRSHSRLKIDNSTGSSRFIDPLAYTTFQRQINCSTSDDQNGSSYLPTDMTELSEMGRKLSREQEVLPP